MTYPEKYLYCIIRYSGERIFKDIAPIGDSRGEVYTVPYDGLAAVVSDSPKKEYESTRANMLAHQQVQERVMREYTLLPVRFDTVAKGSYPMRDIQKLLQKRGDSFGELLADMDGVVELGLKALWKDEDAVFKEVLAENPAIRRLRDSLRREPAEVVRFKGVPLGEMVKKALEQKKSREAADILAPLKSIARRTQENDVLADRVVVNAAFLVDKGQEEAFDRAISAIEEKFGGRLSFRYVGPVPPYNFVNIVVNWDEL